MLSGLRLSRSLPLRTLIPRGERVWEESTGTYQPDTFEEGGGVAGKPGGFCCASSAPSGFGPPDAATVSAINSIRGLAPDLEDLGRSLDGCKRPWRETLLTTPLVIGGPWCANRRSTSARNPHPPPCFGARGDSRPWYDTLKPSAEPKRGPAPWRRGYTTRLVPPQGTEPRSPRRLHRAAAEPLRSGIRPEPGRPGTGFRSSALDFFATKLLVPAPSPKTPRKKADGRIRYVEGDDAPAALPFSG